MQDTKLVISNGSLLFCQDNHENAIKPMELTIDVLGFAGTNTQPSFMWNNIVSIDNTSAIYSTDFDLEIPSEGAFFVEVSIVGQASPCFSCCHNTDVLNNGVSSKPCNAPNNGRPRLTGVSIQFDADSPPQTIIMTPELRSCFNCGC